MNHALAVLERCFQRLPQCGLVGRTDPHVGHRQLDRVLLEAVYARKAGGRQKLAVDAQMRVAARPCPVGQLGVNALAVDHQRRQQTDVLATVILEQLCGDAFGALRHHGRAVMHAMLNTQLHVKQTQEVPDLGGRADR